MSAAIARIRRIGLIVFMICYPQFCEKSRQLLKKQIVMAIDLNRPSTAQIAQKFGNIAFSEIARMPLAVE